jgi:hypothetical protein
MLWASYVLCVQCIRLHFMLISRSIDDITFTSYCGSFNWSTFWVSFNWSLIFESFDWFIALWSFNCITPWNHSIASANMPATTRPMTKFLLSSDITCQSLDNSVPCDTTTINDHVLFSLSLDWGQSFRLCRNICLSLCEHIAHKRSRRICTRSLEGSPGRSRP